MKLSIVIPVFNEQDNLPILNRRILESTSSHQVEIIYIDDGSTDKSLYVLQQLHEKYKEVKIIQLRKNFGQTAAMDAGFKLASGEIIITMDADLQNDPADIPQLLEKINKGFDCVSGWRYYRKDPFFTKKLPSLFSNTIVKLVSGIKVHDQGCSLKAYKKEAIKDLELYGEMHRFIPLILQLKGFRIGEVKVKHHPRRFGKTKYTIKRLFKGFLDLAYIKFWSDFSNKPIHFFGGLGILSILLGTIVGIANVYYHLFVLHTKPFEVGPLLLLAVLMIIVGIQFIAMGFLGEILIRIYYKDNLSSYSVKNINK